MLCEECSHFLEIAEAIRSLGLTILKGATKAHGRKIWICFVVEVISQLKVSFIYYMQLTLFSYYTIFFFTRIKNWHKISGMLVYNLVKYIAEKGRLFKHITQNRKKKKKPCNFHHYLLIYLSDRHIWSFQRKHTSLELVPVYLII